MLALALFLAACQLVDASEPVALVPDSDWSELEVRMLRRAAECWNFGFGTRLRVGRGSDVRQKVRHTFNEYACFFGAGVTELGPQVQVHLCDRYRNVMSSINPEYSTTTDHYRVFLFQTMAHELGHVLNIHEHANDPEALMSIGDQDLFWYGEHDWAGEDRYLFAEANPDFVGATQCRRTAFYKSRSWVERQGCWCDRAGIWQTVDPGTARDLNGVWASSASDVWAVGDGGTIRRFDGQRWSAVASGSKHDLHGVWGSAAHEVWAVGKRGTIVRFDGQRWAPQPSPTARDRAAVWGRRDTRGSYLWAVGESGAVLVDRGGGWSVVPLATVANLRAVGGGFGDVWVAGDGGYLAHRSLSTNNNDWTRRRDNRDRDLRAVGIDHIGRYVRVVGNTDEVLTFKQGELSGEYTFTSYSSGTKAALNGVWADPYFGAWAVGDGGIIMRWSQDQKKWSEQKPVTQKTLNAVWALRSGRAWAVGEGGTVVAYE